MENTFEEDYPEVKPLELGKYQYYINIDGRVLGDFQPKIKFYHVADFNNVFDTKEEAEKAVEKLKAWKRLKDKGLQPVNCTVEHFGREILVRFIIDKPYDEKDLVLLFGGEE